jgi:Fe-S-cluster containining protein
VPEPPRIRLIALHAGYLCRHSGVCCAEPWAIPVERVRYGRLLAALESGHLRPSSTSSSHFESVSGLDADADVVVGRSGRECVFFEAALGRLCAIHRDLGHAAMPSACQHFPRVIAIDPRGVTLTLSHVCPTAGELLFADVAGWSQIVGEGSVVVDGLEWAGLDARESLPPQVHGSLLWDWDSMTSFDHHVLNLLARVSPERALGAIDAAATALARADARPLLARVSGAFADAEATASALEPDVAQLCVLAERCRQGGGGAPRHQSGQAERSAEAWQSMAPHVSRYLAARLLASAVMYHARDVRVWSAWMQACYAVLRTAFACQPAGDAASIQSRLRDAAGDADRLLVHRLDAARFAEALLARTGIGRTGIGS